MMLFLMGWRLLRKLSGFFWFTFLTAIAVMAVIIFVPDYTWDRIAALFTMIQRFDLNNRTQNWIAGLAHFWERPLFGVGAGAFEAAAAHMISVPYSSHSTWLGVIVEMGLFGAVIWFSAWALMVHKLRAAEPALRLALITALVPMIVGMLILGWDHRKVPWLIFVLCLCAGSIRARGEPSSS
jgi:O-antigen ligase